ncbi:MAG: hypothetical protein R6W86_00640 [Marinobacter sp.]|uniref:hypothetical protein n=1 Tax=Marinobacter sp. TaxID=50741 RepID=UPI00396DAF0C
MSKDVNYVVNENAQGHSMLGNSYWRDQGLPIIAQSQWSYLDTFEELGGKNAGRVYQDLEFEYF